MGPELLGVIHSQMLDWKFGKMVSVSNEDSQQFKKYHVPGT